MTDDLQCAAGESTCPPAAVQSAAGAAPPDGITAADDGYTGRSEIQNGLLRFLADRMPPGEPLTAGTDLLETGLLDSMLIMDVCAYIERTHHVTLDHGDVTPRNFRTVEALAALIEKRRSP